MKMKIISTASCAILVFGSPVAADPPFIGTGGAINEFNQAAGTVGVTEFNINVTEHILITDVDATLFMAHTWSGDLIIQLIFGGQSATLVSRIGSIGGTFGSSSQFGLNGEAATPNFFSYTFDSDSTTNIWIEAAAHPAPGSIGAGLYGTSASGAGTPTGALNVFNGMDSFGLWKLRITDCSSPNFGRLDQWSLYILPAPSGLMLLGLAGVLGQQRRRSE